MAEQHLFFKTGRQHPQDAFDKEVIPLGVRDGVVFDPRAAAGHFEVEGKIGLIVGMDPDKTRGAVTGLFDNSELVAHHSPADGMAADDGIHLGRGAGGRAQHFGLAGGNAIIAGTELYKAGRHAGFFHLFAQFAQHPGA